MTRAGCLSTGGPSTAQHIPHEQPDAAPCHDDKRQDIAQPRPLFVEAAKTPVEAATTHRLRDPLGPLVTPHEECAGDLADRLIAAAIGSIAIATHTQGRPQTAKLLR